MEETRANHIDDAEQARELMGRLRHGDTGAWQALYDAHAPSVWKEVARLSGTNSADVADTVQEVFLAAAESAGRFDPRKGTPRQWLMGIARRQVALRLRRQATHLERARRWWQSLNGVAAGWLKGTADAPHEVLENKELKSLVRHTLSQLNEDYQALLIAKYLDEMPAERIAGLHSTTAQAVRAKLVRARAAFREAFGRLVDHGPSGHGS